MQRIAALGAAFLVLAIAGATAAAHAHFDVKSTSPGKGATAATSLRAVKVTFTGPLRSGTLRITGPGRKVASVDGGRRDPRNIARLRVRMKRGLSAGRYKARWTAVSADGHAERLVPVQAAEAMSAGARSRLAATAVAGIVALGGAAAAEAHVQISPTAAAPGDPVEFELLVPGETEAHTIEVALRIPDGVLPFSFEREPGWHRQVEKGDDGSIAVVRWHGQLARDGFVRFAFLASTPNREGDLAWKVIQRYDDGEEAAWIGPPDSDRPAAVTRISASAARQNAGGEAPAEQPATAGSATPPAEASSDGGGDTVALALGAAGLLLGAAALAVAIRRRRPRPRAEAW